MTDDVVAILPDLVEVLLLQYADRWRVGVRAGWGVEWLCRITGG